MLRFFNVTCFPLCPLHTYDRGLPSIDDYILDEYLISSQFWSLFILSFRLDGVSSRFQETSAEFEQARNKARKAKIEFETVKKERYFFCVIDFNKIFFVFSLALLLWYIASQVFIFCIIIKWGKKVSLNHEIITLW